MTGRCVSLLKVPDKVFLLSGGLALPLDSKTNIQIKIFISAAVGKTYKLRQERLGELEAP